MVSTILPKCLLARIIASASATLSSGKVLSIGSDSLPASTAGHRSARISAHDLAHLLRGAGAEGDADIVDALERVQVEVELALLAAEPPDIDDAAEDRTRLRGSALATPPDTRSTIRSTPLSPVAFFTASGHFGSVVSMREVAAELFEPRPPRRIGRGAHHQRRAHELADLQAHQADAGARALDQHGLAALEAAGGDDRVVHGLQRDRKRRRPARSSCCWPACGRRVPGSVTAYSA